MNCGLLLVLFLVSVVSTTADNEASPKIVIVGAGASGIAAASKLLNRGLENVIILEAEDRIGGRVYTTDLDGYAVDLGAQWVHGAIDNIVYEMAAPLDLVEHSNPNSMNIELYASNGDSFDPGFSNETLGFYLQTLDSSSNYTDDYSGSVGDYFQERCQEYFAKHPEINETLQNELLWYFNLLQTGIDGSDTWSDVSAKEYSKYWEHEGDDRMINWKKRGYSTILDILMKKLPDPEKELPVMKKLVLNAEVTKVDYTSDDGKVRVTTSDGNEYTADHVIMTPSLGVLKAEYQTMFDPPLPEEKINSIEGLGFGAAGKILLAFNESWWEDKAEDIYSFSFLWDEEERKEYQSDPMRRWMPSVAAVSVVEHKPRLLHVWISGEGARAADLVADELIFNQTTFLLHKYLSNKFNVATPIAMKRNQWTTNKHFLGTYSFRSMETERRNASTEALAAPILKMGKPVVLFAGEATHNHYFSTVHGAVDSGFREAKRLLEFYNKA